MYIAELKEHVILKEREDGTMEGDEIVEATEYDETVQHLIIDGQVGVYKIWHHKLQFVKKS